MRQLNQVPARTEPLQTHHQNEQSPRLKITIENQEEVNQELTLFF